MAPQTSGSRSGRMTGPEAASPAPPAAPSSSATLCNPFSQLRCSCCPYGFHIDRDFVKFAEEVSSGVGSARKWQTTPRRPRRTHNTPHNDFGTISRSGTTDEDSFWGGNKSGLEDSFVSIASTDDDFFLPTHDIPAYTSYLSAKDFPTRTVAEDFGRRPGVAPSPIASSTPGPGATSENRASPWTAAANSELREIVSRFAAAANSSDQSPISVNGGAAPQPPPQHSKHVTSAPSSPTPMHNYHAVVAAAPVYRRPASSTPLGRESNANVNVNVVERSVKPSPPPPPPRRYISLSRPRVLSPEPAGRSGSVPPTSLRTSNLQSRVYRAQSEQPRENLSGSRVDFDSFASVRRTKAAGHEDALSPTPAAPVSGYRSYSGFSFPRSSSSTRPSADDYLSEPEYRSVRTKFEVTATPVKQNGYSSRASRIRDIDEKVAKLESALQETQNAPLKKITIETSQQTSPPPSPKRPVSSKQDASVDTADLVDFSRPPIPAVVSQLSLEFQSSTNFAAPPPKQLIDHAMNTQRTAVFNMGVNTDRVKMVDRALMPMPPPVPPKRFDKQAGTEDLVVLASVLAQTDVPEYSQTAAQTPDVFIESEVARRIAAEKAERRSMDAITETDTEEPGEFIMMTCAKCDTVSLVDSHEQYEKIVDEDEHERAPDSCRESSNDRESGISNTSSQELDEFERLELRLANEGVQDESKEGSEDDSQAPEIIDGPECSESPKAPRGSPELEFPSEAEPQTASANDDASPPDSVSQYDSPDSSESDAVVKRRSLELPPEPLCRNSYPADPEFDQDAISLDTVSINTMIMVDAAKPGSYTVDDGTPQPKALDASIVEATRKWLTEPSRQSFARESSAYRSYRSTKAKTTDDLDFIASRHGSGADEEPSTPSEGSQAALTDVVMMKKPLSSPIGDTVPSHIPRPKVVKYAVSEEKALTPDEEAEAVDRLTPLRSELQPSYGFDRRFASRLFRPPYSLDDDDEDAAADADADEDEVESEVLPSGDSGDESDGTYELSEREDLEALADFEITAPLKEGLDTLATHVKDPEAPGAVDWAVKYVQHEWLKHATRKNASNDWILAFVEALKEYPPEILTMVVNFTDSNGNTALHYAVSHENYDVVSTLLDTTVSDVDKMNHAGYSPVMLGSLCEIENETHATIVQRLFEVGNVNAQAVKHCQTALQLAASHGRVQTLQLLLKCGADVNMQDVDGSTALMCAAEHGHRDIVKILLGSEGIDASLTDIDNQTALSIAVEQKHKAIALLIYAHLNFTRSLSNENVSHV